MRIEDAEPYNVKGVQMPDQILVDIFTEHLPYEIDMLRNTYQSLRGSPLPTGFLKDALIESFCVHARSLLDFFKGMGGKLDDSNAAEFTKGFVTAIDEMTEPLKSIRPKLNKQIFHLTKTRTTKNADKFDPDYDATKVLAILESEIAQFTAKARTLDFGQFSCNTTPILFLNVSQSVATPSAYSVGMTLAPTQQTPPVGPTAPAGASKK
jgi:hypothetical protein